MLLVKITLFTVRLQSSQNRLKCSLKASKNWERKNKNIAIVPLICRVHFSFKISLLTIQEIYLSKRKKKPRDKLNSFTGRISHFLITPHNILRLAISQQWIDSIENQMI